MMTNVRIKTVSNDYILIDRFSMDERITKRFLYKSVLLMFFFFMNSAPIYCQKYSELLIKSFKPTIDSTHQFIFSKSGGDDVYEIGEKIGYAVLIEFSGKIEYYNRFHRSKPKLEKKACLSCRQIDSLISLFDQFNFSDYPDYLPKNPDRLRSPLSSAVIGFSRKPNKPKKLIKADLTADDKDYPDNFFKFLSELEQQLDSFF
jgi:hypothetical protein